MNTCKLRFSYGEFPEPPKNNLDIVYHYCSMESFDAITSNKTLRLYDLSTMNDPTELYLRNVNFLNLMAQVYSQAPFEFRYTNNGVEGDIYSYLETPNIGYWLNGGGRYNTMSYALCMSKEGDNLAQWRMYANDGKGVCLGFDKNKLLEYTKSFPDAILQDVEYVSSFQKLKIELANELLEEIKKLYESGDTEQLNLFRFEMLNTMFEKAYKYKIDSYGAEREIRFVIQNKSSIILPNATPTAMLEAGIVGKTMDISVCDSSVRAFKTISLEKTGLVSITLGPRNQTSKQMLNMLLAKRDILWDIELYKSVIPYVG